MVAVSYKGYAPKNLKRAVTEVVVFLYSIKAILERRTSVCGRPLDLFKQVS